MRAPQTPSSLKWLISRHARLVGEMAKLESAENIRRAEAKAHLLGIEHQLESATAKEKTKQDLHERMMEAFRADLDATDLLLRQHEVGIDPAIIKPVRSQDNLSLTDYGHLTRLIYRFLQEACGSPRTATQTAVYVAWRLGYDCLDRASFSDFRYRVRKRMQHLAWEGKITRVENQQGSIEGRWCLNAAQQVIAALVTLPLGDGLANSPATNEKVES